MAGAESQTGKRNKKGRHDFIKIKSMGSLLVMMYYTRYESRRAPDTDGFFWDLNKAAEAEIEKSGGLHGNYPAYITGEILDRYINIYESKFFSGKEESAFVRADKVFPAVLCFLRSFWSRKIQVDPANFISCSFNFMFALETYVDRISPDDGFSRLVESFRFGMKKTLSSFAWWEKGGFHRKNLKKNSDASENDRNKETEK